MNLTFKEVAIMMEGSTFLGPGSVVEQQGHLAPVEASPQRISVDARVMNMNVVRSVGITELSAARCPQCNQSVVLKDFLQRGCTKCSNTNIPCFQFREMAIADSDIRFETYQLNTLAWILEPYRDKWRDVASIFCLDKSQQAHIEERYHDELLQMFAVLTTVSCRAPGSVCQLNRHTLIAALQNIGVEVSILDKIINMKPEGEGDVSKFVASQIDDFDPREVTVTNPDHCIMPDELVELGGALCGVSGDRSDNYIHLWPQLAVVLGHSIGEIQQIITLGGGCQHSMFRVLSLSCKVYKDGEGNNILNKRALITALKLIGVDTWVLEEVNACLGPSGQKHFTPRGEPASSPVTQKIILGKRKDSASKEEQTLPVARHIKVQASAYGSDSVVEISDFAKAVCPRCKLSGPWKEILQRQCSKCSDIADVNLQTEKIAITDPYKKFEAHQLNTLAWILAPCSSKWGDLAEILKLYECEKIDIRRGYDHEILQMFAVLEAVSCRIEVDPFSGLTEEEAGPDWSFPDGYLKWSKGGLIEALRKIRVDASILRQINNMKFEGQGDESTLVVGQIDCSDQTVEITNPEQYITFDAVIGLLEYLSHKNYLHLWMPLGIVLGHFLYRMKEIAMKESSNEDAMRRILRLSCEACRDDSRTNKKLDKYTLIMALQLVGVERSDLESINSFL